MLTGHMLRIDSSFRQRNLRLGACLLYQRYTSVLRRGDGGLISEAWVKVMWMIPNILVPDVLLVVPAWSQNLFGTNGQISMVMDAGVPV